ncbi:Transcriptional regulator, LysR family [Rubrivivax sp. A210]|uniref:LysR family transcriptional regulator n=1 Tax=Rubrivivax sp. A210 TaxID=2772301 RepID=UPI0019188E72|nr:LysR family transcriptional regulator [Rubrivivax sp. A210]CAD5374535.1 Transcriptional regulator, LysR family [Rubrivivax sp. A210]
MDKFIEMQTFAAVVDAGSFVRAAEALGQSKAAVSRYVAELEARLGVRLLHRTTRKLSLTDEGQVFHLRCKTLLADLSEAEAEITSRSGQASGLLRVNVPVTFGILHLAPLWAAFGERHPGLTLEVTLADRIVDLVEEGYDLAVRIARLPSSSLVSRKLASTRMILCAAPRYLAEHGAPAHPSDLAGHAVLAYTLLSVGEQWGFEGPEGPVSVKVAPWLRSNSGDTCRAGALQGRGIVMQPSFLVEDDVRAGRLVEVLPQYRGMALDIVAVYPSRQHVAPKVRLVIDFLAQAFRSPPWRG